jgi:DNA-binding winged helix-turn-helix (wHTH) protein
MNLQTLNFCYRYEHWTFEPDQRQLKWHDGLISELTLYETRLLTQLCHHAGEVIGFRQLHQTLFFTQREQSHPLTPTLEETLFSLKQKLTKHPQYPFIIDEVTIYGLRAPIPSKTTQASSHSVLTPTPAIQKVETSYKSENSPLRKIMVISGLIIGLVIATIHFL